MPGAVHLFTAQNQLKYPNELREYPVWPTTRKRHHSRHSCLQTNSRESRYGTPSRVGKVSRRRHGNALLLKRLVTGKSYTGWHRGRPPGTAVLGLFLSPHPPAQPNKPIHIKTVGELPGMIPFKRLGVVVLVLKNTSEIS